MKKRTIYLLFALACWIGIMTAPTCGCGTDSPPNPDMRPVYRSGQGPDLAPADGCLPCSWTETVNCVPSVCVYQSGRLCCLRNS